MLRLRRKRCVYEFMKDRKGFFRVSLRIQAIESGVHKLIIIWFLFVLCVFWYSVSLKWETLVVLLVFLSINKWKETQFFPINIYINSRGFNDCYLQMPRVWHWTKTTKANVICVAVNCSWEPRRFVYNWRWQ